MGDLFGGFVGGLLGSGLGGIFDNGFMEEDRNQQQEWSRGMNQAQRAWMERMSNSAYQRATADMKKAGLNPMLAYSQGGASTPSSSSPSTGSGRSPGLTGAMSGAAHTALQARLVNSQADANYAAAQKTLAEEKEIRERTPTHAVTREQMGQQIRESEQRVRNMIQELRTSAQAEQTSAAQARVHDQQVRNMRETVEQIRATVRNLEAHSSLARSQDRKLDQEIRANLPDMRRALDDLERRAREMDLPRRMQDQSVHDSFIGSLGAVLRALVPLGRYLP